MKSHPLGAELFQAVG